MISRVAITSTASLHGPHFFPIMFFLIFGMLQLLTIATHDNTFTIELFGVEDARNVIKNGSTYYFCCLIVYVFCSQVINIDKFKFSVNEIDLTKPHYPQIFVTGWCVLVISALATLYYINSADRSIFESIISPQKIYFENDGANTSYTSNGYLVVMAGLSSIYSYVLYGYVCYFNAVLRRRDWILLALNILVYILFCIVTSSRGYIFSFAMTFFIMRSAVGRPIPFFRFIVAIFSFFVLFVIISASRDDVDLSEAAGLMLITIGLYSGGATIFNTSLIYSYFEPSNLYHGVTFLWLLAAPIPRYFWPEKPLVALDEIVARDVHGYNDAAFHTTPPGVFGELYMNFGNFGGLIALLVIVLVYLKVIQKIQNKCASKSATFLLFLIYCAAVSRLFYAFLSSSINFTLMNFLITFSQIYVIVYVAQFRRKFR